MKILNQPLAFVDIETSGSNFRNGRVIEIGIVRLEGDKTTTYQTLINPGHPIPNFITSLTGITDQDLINAPGFDEVAEEVSEFIDGAVFVAHNARFDYSFISHEFRRLGAPFRPKILCTVRLSRLLYPSYRGHSLDRLIQRFDFKPDARHRALADAEVLWQFLQRAIKEFGEGFVDEAAHKLIQKQTIPAGITSKLVDSLPHAPGVYVFEDGDGQPLYVGKSVDIRSRVLSHFSSDTDFVKEQRIAQNIKDISYFETAGELGALLLENVMIKRLQPLHNRLQRRIDSLVSLTGEPDENGYIRLRSARIKPDDIPNSAKVYGIYKSEKKAKEVLAELSKKHHLCNKLLGLEKSKQACFGYQLNYCRGACILKDRADVYNLRLKIALSGQGVDEWPYDSPIMITESDHSRQVSEAIVVDRWRPIRHFKQDADGLTDTLSEVSNFDLDTYRLIRRFITNPKNRHKIKPANLYSLESILS